MYPLFRARIVSDNTDVCISRSERVYTVRRVGLYNYNTSSSSSSSPQWAEGICWGASGTGRKRCTAFGSVSFGLDCRSWGSEIRRLYYLCNYFRSNATYSLWLWCLNVTLTEDNITA